MQRSPGTARSWALLWRGLTGWDTAYDPATVAPDVSQDDWTTFEQVRDSINTFHTRGQAARDATSASACGPQGERDAS